MLETVGQFGLQYREQAQGTFCNDSYQIIQVFKTFDQV